MKKSILFKLLLLSLLSTVFSAGAETISMSHKPGKAFTIGSSLSDLLPVKHPEFSLQLFPKHFEVVIQTPLLPGEKPHNRGKANDDESMFAGDAAEFFISVDGRTYYQIAVNPAGLCYTARGRDTSWNPRITTSVTHRKDGWTLRITVPYGEIKTVPPAAGTVWRANFASKVRSGSLRKSCSWSGAQDFHKISEFGTIRFDNQPLPRLLYWNADRDHFNAVLQVPFKYASCKAVCEVSGKKYPGSRSGNLYRWQVPLFSNYVFPKRFSIAKISLVSRHGQVIYSREAKVEPKGFSTFDINSFYYTPKMKELVYQHNFGSGAQLYLRKAGNQLIARYPARNAGRISLEGLKPGRYILELVCGSLRTSRLFKIVPENFSVRPIAPDARFEVKNGLFYLAGKPVFLTGGSTTPQNHLQFAPAFNLNTGNIGLMPNAVQFRGLGQYRFLRKPFSCSYLHPKADQIVSSRMKTVPAGNRQVNRLAYEAQIQLTAGDIKNPQKIDTARYYAELYKKLKAQYPDRYFSIHVDRAACLNDFINSCDIFEFASWRSSYAANMIPHLDSDMKKIRVQAGNRPVVYWLGGSIPDPQCRMAEELRAAVYCAMINNLNGVIFHLGHGGLGRERTRLWSLISGINAEIQPVYQEFASGKALKDFVREVKGNFLWSARQCGKNVVLIVVNLNGSEQQLDMKTRKGNFHVRLTPFEPLVMRFEN